MEAYLECECALACGATSALEFEDGFRCAKLRPQAANTEEELWEFSDYLVASTERAILKS